MSDADALSRTLLRLDGRSYPAYRDLRGAHGLGDGLELFVDHVQGDPFASPSRMRLRVAARRARWPADLSTPGVRRIAFADHLARALREALQDGREGRGDGGGRRGSGHSGRIEIDAGGQTVLERSAVAVHDEWIEARLGVGLPAAGRRILGREAERLLCDRLPRAARRALLAENADPQEARRFVECVENQEAIRAQLGPRRLVAFVGHGAVLPRESGASERPLRGADAVPFASPPGLEVEVEVPHPVETPEGPTRRLRGLGLGEGVTLVVGGGYHGKSTLLRALERGVHPHVPGDGREWVVTRGDAVKIRAEDGRAVRDVDIHPFIDRLPGGRSTRRFSTDDASGSTSQAAAIVEAIEAGSRLLLLDEDTSATNFMVRDARMQALVHREHEPITPFLDRVRELFERLGVSTVLVMGGCGDYFDVADRVIAMRDYRALDATDEARRIAREQPSARRPEPVEPMAEPLPRVPRADAFDPSAGRRAVRVDARGRDGLRFGREEIDLRAVEQIVDASQTRAIGGALVHAARRWMDGRRALPEVLDALDALLEDEGVDALDPFRAGGGAGPVDAEAHPGDLARPRRFEVAAALNRLRTLRMEPSGSR